MPPIPFPGDDAIQGATDAECAHSVGGDAKAQAAQHKITHIFTCAVFDTKIINDLCGVCYPLDGSQTVSNGLFSNIGCKEWHTCIDVRFQNPDAQPFAFTGIQRHLVVRSIAHLCSHKLTGIVVFHPCRVIGQKTIRCRMGFIESIGCKGKQPVPICFNRIRGGALGFHAINELIFGGFDFIEVLFAHSSADDISFTQGKPNHLE